MNKTIAARRIASVVADNELNSFAIIENSTWRLRTNKPQINKSRDLSFFPTRLKIWFKNYRGKTSKRLVNRAVLFVTAKNVDTKW